MGNVCAPKSSRKGLVLAMSARSEPFGISWVLIQVTHCQIFVQLSLVPTSVRMRKCSALLKKRGGTKIPGYFRVVGTSWGRHGEMVVV